jgi:hypothetical protein
MHLPKLDMIVDTYIRIKDRNLQQYISQLRTELIPEIRKLEREEAIIWYAFLVHDYKELGGRVPPTDDWFIHLRLGLDKGADIEKFISELPKHFEKPIKKGYSSVDGIDGNILKNKDWAYAWKVHGEASEWILRMIESHSDDAEIHIRQIIQFMHFITNPLSIGHRCLFFPSGFISF